MDLLKWGWHVVNTRCVWMEQEVAQSCLLIKEKNQSYNSIALIPVMDMLNHSQNPQVIYYFSGFWKII